MITIKRVYEPKAASDGYRVLVDRLWPRGISKDKAGVDLWIKEIGPSNELRQWFAHDVKKWPKFQSKYRQELKSKSDLLGTLTGLEKQHKKLTLLYGARDPEHNQAVVIAKLLGNNG
jgi:uncharacterized protein YeaO (DUF488 family)